MKKIINLTLITILVLSAMKVQAQTLSVDEVKSNICRQVVESNKKYTDADLTATVIALPFSTMSLPDGKVSYEVSSINDKFMARDLKKVNVYVNDKLAKTFNAPVDIKAYKDVLVASGFIERDRMINSSDTVVKKMEVANSLEYSITPAMLGKEIITKKTFREGEIIDKRFVKLKPDVQRNSEVMVSFTSDNMMIEFAGIALADGMIGDYISVENKKYKKVYRGKIIGENKILIQM